MAHSNGSVGGGSALEEVEDEFACAGMLRGSVMALHSSVERIFKVAFTIGDDNPTQENNGQIWLKMRGPIGNVKAAKLFVKGVVNQEEQQEVSFPSILLCVFCGARGLFMDSLIRNTSAHIVIGSPGFLLISGLEKPVVRAYSLISNLIERYEECKGQETGTRSSDKTLYSRRAFKALVEKWEDRHILDLLVLPVSVKEILLDSVHESGLGNERNTDSSWNLEGNDPSGMAVQLVDGTDAGLEKDSVQNKPARGPFSPTGTQRWAEGEQSLDVGLDEDTQLPKGNKEIGLLLKFFTTMGYTEDVVKRVLARTELKEASQILDLVQQEQDRSEQEQSLTAIEGREVNRPCETEHREDKGQIHLGEAVGNRRSRVGVDGTQLKQDEDFVLGVMKKAAASCGYSEQNVAKVYNMLPDRSTHRLLLELQQREGGKEGPEVTEDMVQGKHRPLPSRREPETFTPEVKTEVKQKVELKIPRSKEGLSTWSPEPQEVSSSKQKQTQPPKTKITPPEAGHVNLFPYFLNKPQTHTTHWFDLPTPAQPKQPLQAHQRAPFSPKDPPLRVKDRQGALPSSVTGEQRFLEGLQTPFHLNLTDKRGDPELRMVIIDASNVAMSHGLGHFFSCRGIALAVQHFWDRGHRNIQALLPRWRQKNDPRNKEPHFLGELHDLGLLSYTPSREVQGKRISSYDDRFLLQLADNTDGVIVTNDNLRDLVEESAAWREIIKKRLLQYTFVGDHFMVPDDPLGRGGPHLEDFLRSGKRFPDLGSHPFAAQSQHSRPALLNFYEQTLDVDPDPGAERRKNGAESGQRRGPNLPTRSAEQTAALRESLIQVFPDQDNIVTLVLQCHVTETDINVLSDLILEQQLESD
ncbi:NEDD4-binding protein 1 [Gouania willdenowi]|uniref:NEDD4-binding protein 1-like n=1 Tax=Gouania willdenowi TaxID=441366 RepID=A0A8C5DVJ4_GOUWI|nr:NEDD4-binding protein 1-like [Gouania willdenowi]XP_028330537.1 NEDD4-binding protein 1-like [Gouania willdenowi]